MTNYHKITQIAQSHIYKYMKMNDIKASNYSYHSFFDYMTDKLDIAVMAHTLHNDIAGLSIKDKHGHSSISYQSTHHLHRQNFTKCHELGHFLLEHEGNIFTSSKDTDSLIELEANIFAAQLLAPDIVLLAKITIENKSFQDIIRDMELSNEALQIRLKQLLSDKSTLYPSEIEMIITDYRTRKNNDLKDCLEQLSNKIIQDYQNIKILPSEQIEYMLEFHDIVTSFQLPQLLDIAFRNALKAPFYTGWQFGRGVEFYYAWDNKNMSTEQAKKIAKNTWFNLAY